MKDRFDEPRGFTHNGAYLSVEQNEIGLVAVAGPLQSVYKHTNEAHPWFRMSINAKLNSQARILLMACFADPVVAKLYEIVPLMDRLLTPPNDPHFIGNCSLRQRGHFDIHRKWISE